MPNLWAQDHQLQITLRMSLQDLALQGAGDSIAHVGCQNSADITLSYPQVA